MIAVRGLVRHHTYVERAGHNFWSWRCPHCAFGRCHTWAAAFAGAYWHTRHETRA